MLITGDLASEGVNLHAQCHELIHFDIPWSLIRIEQRNGRIDRYGQRHAPQITTLLLSPETEAFSGDLRVLSRLIEKEHEAHSALGDAASLMGKYDVDAEEDEIRKVLAGKASLDDVVKDTQAIKAEDSVTGMLARIMAGAAPHPCPPGPADDARPVFPVSLAGRLPGGRARRGVPDPGSAGRRRRGRLARLRPAADRRAGPAAGPAAAA